MKISHLALAAAFSMSATAFAGPPAKVAQLDWMTGTWAAEMAPGTSLEENWVKSNSGSIGALVRMVGPEGISMWEFITVEERDGSLVMSLQQWGKGFEPRADVQRFELQEIGDSSVTFKATSEGSIDTLGYSRSGDTFTITLGTPNGPGRPLELKAK
jgi:hypothetical protein